MRPELTFSYDPQMRPLSARCTRCGEQMPTHPTELKEPADAILWLSQQFIEHKRLKHPAPPLGFDPE